MTLKDLLDRKLTKKQLSLVPSSFDIIGNRDKAVAVIELPEELGKKAKLIAKAVMVQHKNVHSVFLKGSERKGVYRLRDLKFVTGNRNSEVIHMESGCRFLLDPKKVYFSPREVTERMRIASMVRDAETVMVFFAGAGAFSIVIAKKCHPKKIIGIEINPDAIGYFKKNIKLNKAENVTAILGDVKEKSAEFYSTSDRIIMPLPESAANYLEDAVHCLKGKGTIHLYCFSEESMISEKTKEIKNSLKKLSVRTKISYNKVLPYGPRIYKYRLDIQVIK